jgi:hypothetical protein
MIREIRGWGGAQSIIQTFLNFETLFLIRMEVYERKIILLRGLGGRKIVKKVSRII